MASPALDPKKMRAIFLPHEAISYHVNQPTQARVINPEATSTKPATSGNIRLRCDFGSGNSFGKSISSLISWEIQIDSTSFLLIFLMKCKYLVQII